MRSESRTLALVTGGNRGIGFETARQLAGKGARVLLAGRSHSRARDAARVLQAEGLAVDPCELDITDEAGIAAAAAGVEERHGRLDVLVNNAGVRVEPYGKRPSEQNLQDWRETFETNLFGTVAVTRAFLPLILRSEAGRIVFVSSLLGSVQTHSDPDSYIYNDKFKSLPAYSASKSAINSFMVHLAYELKDTRVRVGSVHPGYTKTDMNDGDGFFELAEGAASSVAAASADDGARSGLFTHKGAAVPW